MSKETRFLWAWNDHPAQPDPMMTRDRASILLRCWRRSSRKPANHKPIQSLMRVEQHVYHVVSEYGEKATMYIVRA